MVSYPAGVGEFPDAELRRALNKVALGHLGERLDEIQDWAKVLPPAEQQRVAFARILLTKPKAVFLDEATSALDEELEYELYIKLRSECPNTIVVSVRPRHTVEQHHEQQLQLLDKGDLAAGPGRRPARAGLTASRHYTQPFAARASVLPWIRYRHQAHPRHSRRMSQPCKRCASAAQSGPSTVGGETKSLVAMLYLRSPRPRCV